MLKKHPGLILFFVFSGVISASEQKLLPAVEAIQNELVQNFQKTGYGDHEIDLLHKKIGLLVPKMQTSMKKDANGEMFLELEVMAGESSRSTGEHYIVNGYAHIYPGSNSEIKKIVLVYFRQNAGGNTFLLEKRELVNPSPFFSGEDKIDSNEDIILSLYETTRENGEKMRRQVLFKDIDRHERKIKLLDTYKQYLRKTLKALESKIRRIELDNASELLFMLEFE